MKKEDLVYKIDVTESIFKPNVLYEIQDMRGDIITKLSGIDCFLHTRRFNIFKPKSKLYDWKDSDMTWCRNVRTPTIEELSSVGLLKLYDLWG